MKEDLLNTRYEEIITLIEAEFQRNKDRYGEKIKCGKGCSQCCYQIFKITLVDAYFIKKYINSLGEEDRINLKRKAELYLEKLSKKADETYDEYSSMTILPCPALSSEGYCTIYEARPIVCRRFGPPVYDYKNPDRIFACQLNFKKGEEIEDNKLIPNQTNIGIKWDKLKTEFNSEFANVNNWTTIAEAISES